MIINVLVCKADGTQVTEQREVADDYFVVPQIQEPVTVEQRIADLEDAYAEMMGV